MNESQKKVAKIIFKKGLSFEVATKINSVGGWLSQQKGIVKLSKNQLEEAYAWAHHRTKKKQKGSKLQYLMATIISFFMVPFAFSGLLDPSPYIEWLGQFVLGILLILSGIYFIREYWKVLKKEKKI